MGEAAAEEGGGRVILIVNAPRLNSLSWNIPFKGFDYFLPCKVLLSDLSRSLLDRRLFSGGFAEFPGTSDTEQADNNKL